MVYTNSIGAVNCRRYVNIDHRTACAGKLHAPAMQRLTICWFAKEADSAEVVNQRAELTTSSGTFGKIELVPTATPHSTILPAYALSISICCKVAATATYDQIGISPNFS